MRAQHIDNLRVLPAQPDDGFEHRQIGFARAVLLEALPSAHPHTAIGTDPAHECIHERGLADAGFSRDEDDLALSVPHLPEPRLHPLQRLIASDESAARIGGTDWRAGGDSADEAI